MVWRQKHLDAPGRSGAEHLLLPYAKYLTFLKMLNLATLAAGALTVLPALIAASPIRSWSQYANIHARQAAPSNNSQPWNWATGNRKMLGVALGNWLILERWMDEEWFINSCGNANATDEWTWSQSLGSNASVVLEEHWNSWVTEADIQLIAEAGFNHIRIPMGYWAWIQGPSGTPYVTMGGQVDQLTRVIDLAAANGLYVIIDLHGLPGSQNGEQASGHVGYNNFYQAQNIAYGEQTVDAIISYITNSTHRNIISAFAPMNEPIFYSEDQYDALVGYYESTYNKLSTLDQPVTMMFAPGKPETNPFALWQGFINGKEPELLVYEDHPYVGRLAPLQAESAYISQICSKAQQYASYDIPVAVTEWSLSTAITDDQEWNQRFFAANARAWAQSSGSVFWSYRVNAYPAIQDPTENFTLYSFYHLYTSGQIPKPDAGESSTSYVLGLPDECNFANNTFDTYSSVVASVMPTVTNAFTKRSLAVATAAP